MSLFSYTALLDPAWLALLVAIAFFLAVEWFRRPPARFVISTGDTLANTPSYRSNTRRRLPILIRGLGLAMLAVALARPVQGYRVFPERVEVVDIMLCVDVSGSMRAMDFDLRGRRIDRLAVVKEAVRRFLAYRRGDGEPLPGPDRVGLIAYAGRAWTESPLTLDYGLIEQSLDAITTDEGELGRSGTAIGNALGLAIAKLSRSEAQSKVVILLTDGRNNRGFLEPLEAARIAADRGIRVYAIGAGSQSETLVPDPSRNQETLVRANIPVDEASLRRIAEMTGGRYYRALDTASLDTAYEEIAGLERTALDIPGMWEYREGFMPWAVCGSLLVVLSVLIRRMWFDPLP